MWLPTTESTVWTLFRLVAVRQFFCICFWYLGRLSLRESKKASAPLVKKHLSSILGDIVLLNALVVVLWFVLRFLCQFLIVVIVNRISSGNINPVHTPGVLVKNHGPFSWGKDADQAVYNAVVMEQVAKMAFISLSVNPDTTMNPLLVEKHFSRKHGPNAYYGQKKKQ